jgi:hypothetical protein
MKSNKSNDIDYAKVNWGSFTPNLFYPISAHSSIVLKNYNKCSFVYSCHRLKDLREQLIECNSIYFKLYQMITLQKALVAGFTIQLTLPKNYFLR